MRRVVVVAPGRGSYGPTELRTLPRYDSHATAAAARDELLPVADAFRRENKRPTVSELDAESKFSEEIHLPGENASVLTATLSSIDALALRSADVEVVAVCGNSLGWYTALHVAGALSYRDTLRLVETMGSQEGGGETGGQVIYPLVGDDWTPVAGRRDEIDDAIEEVVGKGGFAAWSVDLCGYAVLAGDGAGLEMLRERLPKLVSRGRTYPLPLKKHSAFHTKLVADRALNAQAILAGLAFGRPEIPLIDGRGVVFTPLSTSPAELRDYTLSTQVVTRYDLAASLRVAMREFAPDALVLPGPGESIGGAIGTAVVREGYRGIRDKAAFDEVQESDAPVLLSLARRNTLAALLP